MGDMEEAPDSCRHCIEFFGKGCFWIKIEKQKTKNKKKQNQVACGLAWENHESHSLSGWFLLYFSGAARFPMNAATSGEGICSREKNRIGNSQCHDLH
jgi:hypothetical protein